MSSKVFYAPVETNTHSVFGITISKLSELLLKVQNHPKYALKSLCYSHYHYKLELNGLSQNHILLSYWDKFMSILGLSKGEFLIWVFM